jgi:Asp-tRNA(Asn)/Glu-tRNA(Gln) amidotransferase A subunit family amidase
MMLPLGRTAEGLPLAVQLVGRFGDEGTVFRLAGQLEAAHPWFDRRPDLVTKAA